MIYRLETLGARRCRHKIPRYLQSKNVKNVWKYVDDVRERVERKKLGRAIERCRYRLFLGGL